MHAQQARHLLALVRLSTRQQVEPRQARRLLTVLFPSETRLEIGRLFSNRGHRLGHGLPST